MKYHSAVSIGRGGMGEVLRAWDPALNRHVALKFLRSEDPELEERMIREARAQARINHPNVCPVFEVGRHDGRVFIAMQFVDGRPLDDACRDLAVEHKVSLLRTVAEAVHAAHTAGLIHRDLKPANILVETGEDGTVKPWVVDFGIAREHDVAGATVTGQVLGTPGYVSPEQARGEVSTIDRRTDVFSLGVVLYELVAGCRPHPGESGMESMVSLLSEEPVPLRRHAPHAPRDLETIVMRCLENDRDRRYGSARELADDLGRFLDGRPIEARPVGSIRRIALRTRRHPVIAGVLAVALVTVCGLLVALGATIARSREQAAVAQRLGFQIKSVEDRMRLVMLLPLHDIRREKAQLIQELEDVEQRASQLGRSNRGPAVVALSRGHLAVGQLDRALELLDQAWAEGLRSDDMALTLGHTVGLRYQRERNELVRFPSADTRAQRLELATTLYRDRALELLGSVSPEARPSDPRLLEAEIALYQDDWEEAERLAAAVLSADPARYEAARLAAQALLFGAERAWSNSDPDRAFGLLERGDRALETAIQVARSDPRLHELRCGRWARAMTVMAGEGTDPDPALQKLLDASAQLLTIDPDSVDAHIAVANGWWIAADYHRHHGSDPRPALEQAMDAARRGLSATPEATDAHRFLGLASWLYGQVESRSGGDGIVWLNQAESSFREVISRIPGDTGGHNNLGIVLAVKGQVAARAGEDPEPLWRQAIQSYDRSIEADPSNHRAWLNLGIANTLMAMHRQHRGGDPAPWLDGAIAGFEEAIEIHPSTLQTYSNLAVACSRRAAHRRALGEDPSADLDRGIAALRHALAIDPNYTSARYNLADLLFYRAYHEFGRGDDPGPTLGESASLFADIGRNSQTHSYALAYAASAWRTLAEYRFATGADPLDALRRADAAILVALDSDPGSLDGLAERAEAALVRARWSAGRGEPLKPHLDRAAEAISAAGGEADDSPTLQMARANLARLRIELVPHRCPPGEAETGIRAADRSIDLDPDVERITAIRGVLHLLSQPPNLDEARSDLQTALLRNPALRPEYGPYLQRLNASLPVPLSTSNER